MPKFAPIDHSKLDFKLVEPPYHHRKRELSAVCQAVVSQAGKKALKIDCTGKGKTDRIGSSIVSALRSRGFKGIHAWTAPNAEFLFVWMDEIKDKKSLDAIAPPPPAAQPARRKPGPKPRS